MSMFKLKGINAISFANGFSIYTLYVSIFTVFVDLLMKLFTGVSMFVDQNTWSVWALFVVLYTIVAPILGYILGILFGIFVNLALRTVGGIDIEFE